MAMVATTIPSEVSRLFRAIDLDDNVVRDESDHITMFYLGDDVPFPTLLRAIPLIYEITSEAEPFLATVKRITTFPKGEKGYPIIAPIESKELVDLRNKIQNLFDQRGIEYSKKFPEYKPHLTLGFAKKKPKNIKIAKTQWQINTIGLFGGDNADERLFVSFPLNLKVINKTSEYVLQLTNMWKKSVENR